MNRKCGSLFAGCGIFGKVQTDANIPYDVVGNGTEGEWLSDMEVPSTHERRLYEELVAAGEFEGSFSQFLKEYGIATDDTAGEDGNVLSVMRTDASVNHGNSSGALVNGSGEVIGIVSARSERNGVVGFGYAIPSNLAVLLAENILANSSTHGASIADAGFETAAADTHAVYDEQAEKYHISEKAVAKSATEKWGSPARRDCATTIRSSPRASCGAGRRCARSPSRASTNRILCSSSFAQGTRWSSA